jgi:hypothetical protein
VVASSISLGTPAFLDDAADTGQTPFRTYEIGSRVLNVGTSSANQVAGGVFPGGGAMGVSPGSGMAVQVAAGYCCVPNATSTQGGYVFGTMVAQSLTLASADPSNPRIDLVVAYVNDLGTSASACYVQVVTGTAAGSPSAPAAPSPSITLAQVYVAAGVASITTGNITDERSYVVPPGGILPIQNAAAAPAVPASQLMYNLATGTLCQGTGTAGNVASLPVLPWAPVMALATTSVTDSAAKGSLTTIASLSFTTSGSTDIEVYYKWPGFEVSAAPLLVTLEVQIGSTVLDQTVIYPASSSNRGAGGSARYFTSSGQGNTPAAGTYTVTFSFQSASGSATTTMFAASTAPAILRVTPVVT